MNREILVWYEMLNILLQLHKVTKSCCCVVIQNWSVFKQALCSHIVPPSVYCGQEHQILLLVFPRNHSCYKKEERSSGSSAIRKWPFSHGICWWQIDWLQREEKVPSSMSWVMQHNNLAAVYCFICKSVATSVLSSCMEIERPPFMFLA